VKGTPTPAVLAAAYYTSSNLATPGVVIPAASFSILNGIATIVLNIAVFPLNGYCGPNGYPKQNATTGAEFDIQAKWPAANGQQVTLWGFTTATYFNGKRITVLDCNPALNSFRFYFNHANVGSTADVHRFHPHTHTCPCGFVQPGSLAHPETPARDPWEYVGKEDELAAAYGG